MKNDRFVTIRCIFVPVGWDAASPGNEKIRLPNDRTYAGAAAQPLVCLSFPDAFFFCPGTPEPLPVSRHPSASSDSLFRKPPGPAAPIDRKRLFPACESCLPPAPPLSSAPAPRTASGIPAPVCSVRFAFSNASRPCGPDRPQAPFSGPRIVPSACTAAIFGPGTPEPLSVSRRPSASSGTGRTRKAPTLREKCRGIRRSGRSAHPCGPRHGYSAPPVADGVFSVHRCFSISTNHSGQRHGRRVSLRMNPSTVDPVLSSSPRSFRIS